MSSTPSAPLPNVICPLCGGNNQCGPANTGSFDTPCWCKTASISPKALAKVPKDQINQACLCPRCAAGLSE